MTPKKKAMKAPERIWVEPDGEDLLIHNNAPNLEALISTGYLTEYVTFDHANAMVGAAFIEGFNQSFVDFSGNPEPTPPSNAAYALDRLLSQAREEALIDAYNAIFVVPAVSMEQEQMAQRCQAALRALARSDREGE